MRATIEVQGFRLVLLVTAAVLCVTPVHAQEIRAETWDVVFPTSASDEAQEHFLNGVTAYHLFMFEDALEHFRAAQNADPDFALAYWGEALSHHRTIWSILNLDEGRAALAKLAPTAEARAAKAPTDREKAYLEAVELLYAHAGGTRREREVAYSAAMGELHQQYPDDVEALALYTLSRVLIYPRTTATAERMATAAMAQEVLARNPRHPGAPRYLIQTTDDPVHGVLGFQAVRALQGWSDPGGAESIHIPSHVYLQQGMWDAVSVANATAFETSMAWSRDHGYALEDLNNHNYGHLLLWKAYADLQRGKPSEARAILERAQLDFADSGRSEPIGTAFYRLRAQFMIETGEGELAADLATDAKADGFFDNPLVLQGVGIGAALVGEVGLARQAADSLGSLAGWRAQAGQLQTLGLIALAEGNEVVALESLERSVALNEENILSHGLAMPNPLKPTWELYGEVLLQLGQYDKAAAQFERALEVYRRRPASLLGAARANEKIGRLSAASTRYAELADVWHQADDGHPALDEVRRFLSN